MTAPPRRDHRTRPVHVLAAALAGVLAGAAAVGAAQFAAGLGIPQSSPVVAVGQAAIDLAPPQVKEFAIATFGANDKAALLGGILVILALYAAVVGILAVRRFAFGLCGLAVFAAIGLAAVLTRPDATVGYVVPTVAGAAAGAVALFWLARAARGLGAPPEALYPPDLRPGLTGQAGPGDQAGPGGQAGPGDRAWQAWQPGPTGPDRPAQPPRPDPGREAAPIARAGPAYSFTGPADPADQRPSRWPARRQFLFTAGAAAGTAALGTLAGKNLAHEHNIATARTDIRFPRPATLAPPLPAGSNLGLPGLSSFVTPDRSFYRVDTALLVPQVDPARWSLRIHGMVQREVTITFADLLRRPLIEAWVTLTCVSNPVGGPYVGNARWLGASLASLIREARPQAGANQLLCTSVDGFTSGTPLPVVLDGRDALLAVAMNGAALPIVHGFPARMVVPGLYGYVSATKWVTDIEVTTFAAARAFWAQRGWAQQAPIKTECRIDVPAAGAKPAPGRTSVAGVAWAQHKGIAAVEVRVDGGGPWHQARLATVPGIDTWRQWVWDWPATPGPHELEARATDATGYTQTAVAADTIPNGASGYPSVQVTVRTG
ncbi:MAG TPA: molybdopterin-dependent oxidoreductase [Streptosporangiaceae bacterium]|jgi:DMSO/TMAO reductase YedYZ molybdopterin-dependent catalytic subunit